MPARLVTGLDWLLNLFGPKPTARDVFGQERGRLVEIIDEVSQIVTNTSRSRDEMRRERDEALRAVDVLRREVDILAKRNADGCLKCQREREEARRLLTDPVVAPPAPRVAEPARPDPWSPK